MQKIISTGGKIFIVMFLLASGFVAFNANASESGDVIINEFIANPTGSDTDKEWLEVKNLSDTEINLNGWHVTDTANHPITGDYIIPSQGIAVICRNATSSENGGVTCNYQANLTLANSGERSITLKDESDIEIDSIAYTDPVEGKSFYLSDNVFLTEEINTFGDGDFGTPGYETETEETTTEADILGDISGYVDIDIYNFNIDTFEQSTDLSFKINASGTVSIYYGLTENFGNQITIDTSLPNENVEITLNDLICDTTYYYSISILSANGEQTLTSDSFVTESCLGLAIDSITQTKTNAKANNSYENGWEWEFNITAFDETEDELQMQFSQWENNAHTINSSANMRFSIDDGQTWHEINANDEYSEAVSISGIDNDETAQGNQLKIIVQTKIPVGSITGNYGVNYGILVE